MVTDPSRPESDDSRPGDADGTMDAYNAIAAVYGEYSTQRQNYLDAVDRLVLERLKSDSRLLDVGAGDGRRLSKIRDELGLTDFVAVEPSPEMARICREVVGVEVHETFAEELGTLDIGTFDVVTALWNVFGHIASSELRVQALRGIRGKLRPGGRLVLDVNNRHNAASYGHLTVLKRTIVDRFNFDERRGDASYEWKIGDKSFQASGHLFTPTEIERLFSKAALSVEHRCSVDYSSGEISTSPWRGQLFYILTAA